MMVLLFGLSIRLGTYTLSFEEIWAAFQMCIRDSSRSGDSRFTNRRWVYRGRRLCNGHQYDACRRINAIPVSYTHLDVYKRQHLG